MGWYTREALFISLFEDDDDDDAAPRNKKVVPV